MEKKEKKWSGVESGAERTTRKSKKRERRRMATDRRQTDRQTDMSIFVANSTRKLAPNPCFATQFNKTPTWDGMEYHGEE